MAYNPNENKDKQNQGREDSFMDIDRMINEGLGGGNVTLHNGLIEATTTDTMNNPESILAEQESVLSAEESVETE
ncbi:hypothetical protein [Paenibacillus eucommiae]|uniref:DUF4025 domain-containing protein n=1 Tax=Paenibacillus eucommiae TaxID=1355755 RepID=A0ABS4J595_9BACL|nr:hypothetical protein [Paenibacillus eucommiae]MBP1995002.1 hypothetical protein [Paenibacillus eucommiae]